MKKTMILAVLFATVLTAWADMDGKDYRLSLVGNVTNSQTYVIRGELHGVFVDVPAGTVTGTVTVATAQETLFTRAITTDGMYRPRVATHTTAGALATFNTYSATNMAAGATAAEAQTWYSEAAMAGPVTVTIVQDGAGTNWHVRLIYKR